MRTGLISRFSAWLSATVWNYHWVLLGVSDFTAKAKTGRVALEVVTALGTTPSTFYGLGLGPLLHTINVEDGITVTTAPGSDMALYH
jgi:hypothetical protein